MKEVLRLVGSQRRTPEPLGRLPRELAVAAASAVPVVVSAALIAFALDQGRSAFATEYLWASIAASVPAVVGVVLLVRRRSNLMLPGLSGMLAGAAALAVDSSQSIGIDPLAFGLATVLVVGLLARPSGRFRLVSIGQSAIAAYLAIALIYELTISLHNL